MIEWRGKRPSKTERERERERDSHIRIIQTCALRNCKEGKVASRESDIIRHEMAL